MRIIIFIALTLSFLLSGCKTYKDTDFVNDEMAYNFSEYFNIFSEIPLKEQDLEEGQSIYRVLVLPSYAPVHMIKVSIDRNGTASVSIRRTQAGTFKRFGKKVEAGYELIPSTFAVKQFLQEISRSDFWHQDEKSQYRLKDRHHLHQYPRFFIDGISESKYIAFVDSGDLMRKNTSDIILAYYGLASLTEEDDWTQAEYLKTDWQFEN